MKSFSKIFYLIILTTYFVVLFVAVPLVKAEDSIDVVTTYNVIDPAAADGDIMVSTDKGLTRANVESTNTLFGVFQSNPVVVYKSIDDTKKPVSRAGVAAVNVTTLTGDIKEGDFITSSTIPGKGEKAIQSGYVIGIALEN